MDGSLTFARLRGSDLVIDEEARAVTRGGRRACLTPTEFSLLCFLARNAGRILSKRQILDHVWSLDSGVSENTVETYIRYLRRKIDHCDPPMIQTVRGLGYTLRVRS